MLRIKLMIPTDTITDTMNHMPVTYNGKKIGQCHVDKFGVNAIIDDEELEDEIKGKLKTPSFSLEVCYE